MRLRIGQRPPDDRPVTNAPPDDLPKLASHGCGRMQREQLRRAFVGKENALIGVYGRRPLRPCRLGSSAAVTIGFQLGELGCQTLAHVIEAAGQSADLILAGHVNLVSVAPRGNSLRSCRQFLKRSGDPTRRRKRVSGRRLRCRRPWSTRAHEGQTALAGPAPIRRRELFGSGADFPPGGGIVVRRVQGSPPPAS